MTKKQQARIDRLCFGRIPRYVRCYDFGGDGDRYTVVFTGRIRSKCGEFPYLGMNGAPFHPQGIGQHGSTQDKPCDTNKWGWAPAVGRSNHLGKRIEFIELPIDCQKLAWRDYAEIWGIPNPFEKSPASVTTKAE